jgi:hypothetical protein
MSQPYRGNEQNRRGGSSRNFYRDDSRRNEERGYSPGWDERGDDRFAEAPQDAGRRPYRNFDERGRSWPQADRNRADTPSRGAGAGRTRRYPDAEEGGLYAGPSRAYGLENERLFGDRHEADAGGNIYGTRTFHSPPAATPHYSTGSDYIDPYAEYGNEFEYGASGTSGLERGYGSPGRARYESAQSSHQGRGPKGYARSDERLREIVCERLTEHPAIDASDITVQVADQEVTLSGTVDDRGIKHLVEDLVDGLGGVKEIHNQLRVRNRESFSASPQSAASDRVPRTATGSTGGSTQSNSDLSAASYDSGSSGDARLRKNS